MPIAPVHARCWLAPDLLSYSCESRSPGLRNAALAALASCFRRNTKNRRKVPQTKMGAGIAADPLSPDFDPLIRLSEESEPRRLVSAAAPPRAASGAKALRFGHRGRARYSCEPQRHGLDGQLGVPDRSPFTLRLGHYMSNRLPPGDERSRIRPSRPTPFLDRGDAEGRFGPPFLLPFRRRLHVRTSRPSATCEPASEARRTLRPSSLLRHKLLISLRFPASSSSAYSHEGVIESESCQWPKRGSALWIMWISWSELCVAA
jgi:hypothetical protein